MVYHFFGQEKSEPDIVNIKLIILLLLFRSYYLTQDQSQQGG